MAQTTTRKTAKRTTTKARRAPKKKQKQVVLLRTSERTAFKRCRWAWNVTYNEQLKPKVSAPPLRFGSLVHKALELRYPPGIKRGPHPAITFQKLYNVELKQAQTKFGFRDDDGIWHEAGHLGVSMLEHFIEVYDKDSEWKVIQSELAFQVPIFENDTHQFVYVGIIDGVWQNRSTKELWLRDWKTARAIPQGHGSHLTLDEQPGSYWAYAPEFLRARGILTPKQKLRGIDFLYMRKALKDGREQDNGGRYLNKDGSVSAKQPAPYFVRVPTYRTEAEIASLRERVLQEANEHALVRAGELAVYKNPSQMNCAGCGLRDACEIHEAGQDWRSILDSTFVPWAPYAEHEIRNAELR